MKNKLEMMDVTPEWGSFFELAKQLVQSCLAKDQGRELVLEMLEYGKKLDKNSKPLFKHYDKTN